MVIGVGNFIFESSWIVHLDYEELEKNYWYQSQSCTQASLNKIKEYFVIFDKDVFRNIFKRKKIENGVKNSSIKKKLYGTKNLENNILILVRKTLNTFILKLW